VRLASRSGETTLRADITDKVSPGVVYTTFHHPDTQANVITTDFSDWATNCPEYKVTAVQVSPRTGPSEWQEDYAARPRQSRRIASGSRVMQGAPPGTAPCLRRADRNRGPHAARGGGRAVVQRHDPGRDDGHAR
jgi:hypothetical protein